MSVTAFGTEPPLVGPDELSRWSAALLFVLAAHVLLVVFALAEREPAGTAAEPPAAILIDLAASSPSEASPSELPPAPDQIAAPDAPPAPIEDRPEELTNEALQPTAVASVEPVHEAVARPVPEIMNTDDLNPAIEMPAQPVAEATAERLPELVNRDELRPMVEAVTDPVAEAVARPFPDMPVMGDLAPSAEATTEPVPQAIAEIPDLAGTVDLALSAEIPAEPASAANAEASPDMFGDRVDLRSLESTTVANSSTTPPEAHPVEADPTALQNFILAPLPRPRPGVTPQPAPVVTPTPRRTETETAAREPEATPRRTPRRSAAARPPAPETTAPAAQPQQSAAASAPRAGAAAAPSVSPDRWQSAVYRHLERNKRYPRAAESRRIGGTVRVRFTIDRNGNILGHRITASSGHPELDEAVSAMIGRASPVPAPPSELYRSGMSIEVPIRFSPR